VSKQSDDRGSYQACAPPGSPARPAPASSDRRSRSSAPPPRSPRSCLPGRSLITSAQTDIGSRLYTFSANTDARRTDGDSASAESLFPIISRRRRRRFSVGRVLVLNNPPARDLALRGHGNKWVLGTVKRRPKHLRHTGIQLNERVAIRAASRHDVLYTSKSTGCQVQVQWVFG